MPIRRTCLSTHESSLWFYIQVVIFPSTILEQILLALLYSLCSVYSLVVKFFPLGQILVMLWLVYSRKNLCPEILNYRWNVDFYPYLAGFFYRYLAGFGTFPKIFENDKFCNVYIMTTKARDKRATLLARSKPQIKLSFAARSKNAKS